MSKEAQLEAMVKRLDAEVARLDEMLATKSSRVSELESTVHAMAETAAEQSRVHVEMHGDLVVQDELILKLGGESKRYRKALEDIDKLGDLILDKFQKAGGTNLIFRISSKALHP